MISTLFLSFCLKLIILILAEDRAIAFGESSENERHPGLILQYTEDFMSIIHQESIRYAFEELQKSPLQYGFSGKVSTTLLWSTIRYKVKDFVLVGYEQPTAKVSLTKAKGFLVNMSLPVLKFRGKYTFDLYNGPWFEYSRRGAMVVTIFGTSLEWQKHMTLNEDGDRIKWTTLNCSGSIKDIDVDLQDPISNALTVGIEWDEEIRLFQEQFCEMIKWYSEVEVGMYLYFTNDIYLDYTLIRHFEIYSGYLESYHVAEFRYRGDKERFTRLPQPIVMKTPTELVGLRYRMSDFMFNSFGYVVHNHKLLSFTYTRLDLPMNRKHLLDTTCGLECFGKLFPNASKTWPDSSVEISVTTSGPPYVLITPDSFKVIFGFNIEAYARLANDSAAFIFSIHLFMSAFVAPNINSNSIHFEMQNQDANITIIDSRIGQLHDDDLLVVISQAFQKFRISVIKQFTIDGFKMDLDLPNGVFINEHEFNFMNGDLSLFIRSLNAKEKKSYIDLTGRLLTRKQKDLVNMFFYVVLR